MVKSRPWIWIGLSSATRTRSATWPASELSVASQTMTNSSPPIRTTTSLWRTAPTIRPATSCSTVSPIRCPKVSLSTLKPSKSQKTTATEPDRRPRSATARSR